MSDVGTVEGMTNPISIALPSSPTTYRKWRDRFHAWLKANGSEVRQPHSEYELDRFTTPEGVGVVYRNGADVISSWTGGSDTAFRCFREMTHWRAAPKPSRGNSNERRRMIENIISRDGSLCFYCGTECQSDDQTVEELVPITQGGKRILANVALAHTACNQRAGSRSVMEKIKLREQMRGASGVEQRVGEVGACLLQP